MIWDAYYLQPIDMSRILSPISAYADNVHYGHAPRAAGVARRAASSFPPVAPQNSTGGHRQRVSLGEAPCVPQARARLPACQAQGPLPWQIAGFRNR
jgi:hypothetical protein